MDDLNTSLIKIPYNKLVLKKRYLIITKMHELELVYTGTYYYMFGPNDHIEDLLGLGQPVFIDIKPNIENKTMLICNSCDEFYDLKVKIE